MNDMTSIDRAVGDWLEASGPPDMATDARDAAFVLARSVGQRRGLVARIAGPAPWPPDAGSPSGRWEIAPATTRLAIIVALLALALLATLWLAAGGSPVRPSLVEVGPTSAPSASAAASAIITSPAPAASRPAPVLAGEPWLVYEWVAPGGDGLFLVRPDGTDGRQILTALGSTLMHPDWSPDGSTIAFEKLDGTDQIWAADADGANARRLVTCLDDPCKQVFYPAWSPDGTELAYARFDHSDALGERADRLSIEVVTLATGTRRVVARAPAPDAVYPEYIYPRWSPDGRSIAFTIDHYPVPIAEPIVDSAIAVVASDGSQADAPRVITNPVLFAAHADWHPTDDRLVFGTYDLAYFQSTQHASNLYSIRPDGTGLTQLTSNAPGGSRAVIPSWTPDGTRVVFTNVASNRLISFANPDGSAVTSLAVPGTDARLRPVP